MTGYLQRLLDAALPASDPPALRPVIKSTSPIFEQNQLLGLAGLDAVGADAEAAPRTAEAPAAPTPSAPTPRWPASVPAVPARAISRHDPFPVAPASPTAVREPTFVASLPPPLAAASAAPPLQQEPPETVPAPAGTDPEPFEPAPRPEIAEPEHVTDLPATLVPQEPVVAAAVEQVATEVTSASGPDTTSQLHDVGEPAAARIVARDLTPALEPIGRVSEALPPPRMLEPRPRPSLDDTDPTPDQSQAETLQGPPRINIGRVMVELVPDPAPLAQAARTPRTAAAASMIGPLGNRRARRRLFALSRL